MGYRTIHKKFMDIEDDMASAVNRLAVAKSRLTGSAVGLLGAQQEATSSPTLLQAEITRLQRMIQTHRVQLSQLKRKRDLRIDNVFERCRQPFQIFPWQS